MADLTPDFKPLEGFNEKTALRVIYAVTAVVILAILAMFLRPKAAIVPEWVHPFPMYNAILNGTCFFVLLAALWAVKRRNYVLHMRLNIFAFILSAFFILFYIGYHVHGIETRFPSTNPLKPLYLIILVTHIITAAIVLPLILLTFYYALSGKYNRHRAIAQFSYPIWLYVTATGPIVYLMISPYYSF